MWFIYTVKYLPRVKMNEVELHVSAWINLDCSVEWQKQVAEDSLIIQCFKA